MCLLAVNKNQLNKLSLKEVVNDLPKVDFGAKKSEGNEVNLYPTREVEDNLEIAAEPNEN
jgi:hypothetical protein